MPRSASLAYRRKRKEGETMITNWIDYWKRAQEKYPAINPRIQRAKVLLEKHSADPSKGIIILRNKGEKFYFLMQPSNPNALYRYTIDANGCDCPDKQANCKHKIACYTLAAHMGIKLTTR